MIELVKFSYTSAQLKEIAASLAVLSPTPDDVRRLTVSLELMARLSIDPRVHLRDVNRQVDLRNEAVATIDRLEGLMEEIGARDVTDFWGVRRSRPMKEFESVLPQLRKIAQMCGRETEFHATLLENSVKRAKGRALPFQDTIFGIVSRSWMSLGGKVSNSADYARYFRATVRPIFVSKSVQEGSGCAWSDSLLRNHVSAYLRLHTLKGARGRPRKY